MPELLTRNLGNLNAVLGWATILSRAPVALKQFLTTGGVLVTTAVTEVVFAAVDPIKKSAMSGWAKVPVTSPLALRTWHSLKAVTAAC